MNTPLTILSEDEQLFRQSCRSFAQQRIQPLVRQMDEEAKLEEDRFLREARLCAGLPKHPNIVGVYDAGVIGGRRYLAMEFVDGLPMDKWLKKGSL